MFKIMWKSNYDKMVKLQGCLEDHVKSKNDEIVDILRSSIRLNGHEMQSGLTRVKNAEGLISQLPKDHEGRNTWLMNYGVGEEAKKIRKKHQEDNVRTHLIWDGNTQSLTSVEAWD